MLGMLLLENLPQLEVDSLIAGNAAAGRSEAHGDLTPLSYKCYC